MFASHVSVSHITSEQLSAQTVKYLSQKQEHFIGDSHSMIAEKLFSSLSFIGIPVLNNTNGNIEVDHYLLFFNGIISFLSR